jgi:uncharacterized protein YozE (UPF0346 family)
MAYRASFYQYLMTLRDPDSSDEVVQFANNAQFDSSFPKQAQDYKEISDYLELNTSYLPTMTIFDRAYQMYLDKMN